MADLTYSRIPGDLQWSNPPVDWQRRGEDGLVITTGAETDWFVDPGGAVVKKDAPAALFAPPDGDFWLRARVTVDFQATYDAGVLCIDAGDACWAKLCFEFSPQRQPMVVSVVTRGVSDDCNSTVIAGNSVYLRIHRRGSAWAFHYSLDGETWSLVRYFALDADAPVRAGFLAQSPTGKGCQVLFTELACQAATIVDLRSGE